MRRLALLLLLPLVWAGPAPAPDPPGECGVSDELPGFALEDVNPNSSTFGEVRAQGDFLGEVLVVYWAQAT